MNTLNLGSDEMPEKKKKSNTRNLKIALGLAAVILVPTIGSTLAGNIGIGTGSIEFGQGVLTTAACDTAITIVPQAALIAGAFIATTIAVSGIDDLDCDGQKLTIKMLNIGNEAQVIGGTDTISCTFIFDNTSSPYTTTYSTGVNNCPVLASPVADSTSFTFNTATAVATTAFEKITIESSTP
jgi:hypothetical protein